MKKKKKPVEKNRLDTIADVVCNSKSKEDFDSRPHIAYLANAMMGVEKDIRQLNIFIFAFEIMHLLFRSFEMMEFMNKHDMEMSGEVTKELKPMLEQMCKWIKVEK